MGTTIQKIKVEGAEQAKKEITGVQGALDAFNETTDENRDAVSLLDKATGGAITSFKRFQKGVTQGIVAVKGLSKSFKGMKTALIATGIGAFVVALGLIVTYWDDIVDFITGASEEQQRLNDKADRTVELLDQSLGILEQQISIAKLRGESAKDLVKELRKELIIQQEILNTEIERRTEQLEQQKLDDSKLTFMENLNVGFNLVFNTQKGINNLIKFQTDESEEQKKKQNEITKLKSKSLSIDQKLARLDKEETDRKKKNIEEIEKKKTEAKQKELDDIKNSAKLQEQIEDALIITKEEKRAKERADINKHYEDLLFDLIMAEELTEETELALMDAKREKLLQKQAEFDEEDAAIEEEEKKKFQDSVALNIKEKQDILDAELELQQKQRDFATDTLDNTARLFGEETKLGKAALLAKQLIAAKAFLIDIGALKNKASITMAEANLDAAKGGEAVASGLGETLKLGFPDAILPLIAYGATAAGVIGGIISAVKSTKKVAASVGGSASGSSTTPQKPVVNAPAFNIVGQSETSQLTETIAGATQEPVRAYVVSTEITTAQSLERNIVQGATIG
jgi:hypothetical protein